MSKAEKSCLVSYSSTTPNKFGDRPPSTYSLKIQSLSQLNDSLLSGDRYKSRTFSSGKLEWKLLIYPNGNQKDNGSGFVSMYVELDSTSVVSTVLAYVTFFVYNNKQNKYLTIQDVEGKQFNALRPMWGLPQVLLLDTFNDPKNGYVFEGDQCEFGVDVIVPLSNWEVVSFSHKPSNPKFSWTVKKFSKLKKHCYISDNFLVGGHNWVLKLYPKGSSATYCKWLSLYFDFADSETVKAGERIYMRVLMRIVDPFGDNHVKYNFECWDNIPFLGLGWHKLLSLEELRKAYLDKEGSLNIEIEFEVVSTTKYSPP